MVRVAVMWAVGCLEIPEASAARSPGREGLE